MDFCKPSVRGLAFLSAANFISRAVVMGNNIVNALFTYEMELLYGAHLDSHILLFFQGVFMIPVSILGYLVFLGVDKQSFNLVLYPSLVILFLVLLRYGAELALLIIHWEDHKLDMGPSLLYYFVLDMLSWAALMYYVYILAPLDPNPGPLRRRLSNLHIPYKSVPLRTTDLPLLSNLSTTKSNTTLETDLGPLNQSQSPIEIQPESTLEMEIERAKRTRRRKPPAVPPPEPPPSPKFNYNLRRNIDRIPQGSPERALVEELDRQKLQNSKTDQEQEENSCSHVPVEVSAKTQSLRVYEEEPKRRSLIIETDLDAKSENGSQKRIATDSSNDASDLNSTGKEVENEPTQKSSSSSGQNMDNENSQETCGESKEMTTGISKCEESEMTTTSEQDVDVDQCENQSYKTTPV